MNLSQDADGSTVRHSRARATVSIESMVEAANGRPTALYRLFDPTGRLLYIGITFDPTTRLRQHRRQKAWWPEVDTARTRVTWHTSRVEAEVAELAAIRDERPEYNIISSDSRGCARFLPRHADVRWGRRPWIETAPPEVLSRIDETVRLRRHSEWLKSEFRAALLALVRPDGSDVPVAHIAGRLGVDRKTIYRHMQAAEVA